jgi:hypothetical protein
VSLWPVLVRIAFAIVARHGAPGRDSARKCCNHAGLRLSAGALAGVASSVTPAPVAVAVIPPCAEDLGRRRGEPPHGVPLRRIYLGGLHTEARATPIPSGRGET